MIEANVPAGQPMQAYELFAASAEENVPAGQTLQLDEPGKSEYVPGAQRRQSNVSELLPLKVAPICVE